MHNFYKRTKNIGILYALQTASLILFLYEGIDNIYKLLNSVKDKVLTNR